MVKEYLDEYYSEYKVEIRYHSQDKHRIKVDKEETEFLVFDELGK